MRRSAAFVANLGPASMPRADYCFDRGGSTKAASTLCAARVLARKLQTLRTGESPLPRIPRLSPLARRYPCAKEGRSRPRP